ncbi:ribosomal protein S18 acetylase RimI-like enzyme [Streptacidiphilus sp. BW17]
MTSQGIGHAGAGVRLNPSDLGRRVMIRRVAGFREGRPLFTDVLGVFTSWDNGVLTVVNRAGEAVAVPVAEVVAGKPVPPAPVRRSASAPESPTPAELQRIAARGWAALEQEPLGEWMLRASSGFTRRGNSAQTLGDPGLPLPEALTHVQAWYAERGLPGYVEVTEPGSPEGLGAALAERGASEAETLVRTAPLADLVRATRHADADVRLFRTAGPEWLARYQRVGGDPAKVKAATSLLHSGPSVWFASVSLPEISGGPAAIGRAVVDGAWVGMAAIEVAPEARRRGLATALMSVLAARAAEEGATAAYLQVEAENEGAQALYDKLGFDVVYRYRYARLGS